MAEFQEGKLAKMGGSHVLKFASCSLKKPSIKFAKSRSVTLRCSGPKGAVRFAGTKTQYAFQTDSMRAGASTRLAPSKSMGEFIVFDQVRDITQRLHRIDRCELITENTNCETDLLFVKAETDLMNIMTQQSCFPPAIFTILKDLIDFHFFRPRSDVPERYYHGDIIMDLAVTHLEEMKYMHNIFQLMFDCFDPRAMKTWITRDFIKRYMELFHTPDRNELAALEESLYRIVLLVPEAKDFMARRIFVELDRFVDGVVPHFGIASLLNILQQLFLTNIGGWPSDLMMGLCKTLLSLFKSAFLMYFYDSLNTCLSMLMRIVPNLAEFDMEFLIAYWPRTASSKQAFFIHHLSRGVQALDGRSGKRLAQQFVQRFAECLVSNNFKVVVMALNLISDPGLRMNLDAIVSGVSERLIKNMDALDHHWSMEIRNLARSQKTKIAPRTPSGDIEPIQVTTEDSESDSTRDSIWERIREAAAEFRPC